MNTTETGPVRAGRIVAAGLLCGLALFLCAACGRAPSARPGSAEAIRLLDFSCNAGETERIESWGRSGASRGCYRDNREHGRFVYWEEGYVNLEGYYSGGMKDGTWTVFNGDGSVFAEIVFAKGVKTSKVYH